MMYLKLRCSSPSQYYARQQYTPMEGWFLTERHPTKNAITGLLGAALGIKRGDPALNELKKRITVKYTAFDPYTEVVDKNTPVGTFFDFQTVRPKEGECFTTVNGKPLTDRKKNSIIKHVEFIQNAGFFVYVGSEDESLLHDIHRALRDPKYRTYLGKKRCILNRPIIGRQFAPLSEKEIGDVYNCL